MKWSNKTFKIISLFVMLFRCNDKHKKTQGGEVGKVYRQQVQFRKTLNTKEVWQEEFSLFIDSSRLHA